MSLFDSTPYQKKQIEVIDSIENQIQNNSFNFSTVEPIQDYDNDPRICLTGVHLLKQELIDAVYDMLINPLQTISPDQYYYGRDSLHLTIKNVRIINDPPRFSDTDIQRTKKVFETVIPKHKKFQVYFYRLLLFPSNLALIGTTDPELDSIVLELDQKLKAAGISDDKQYANSQYFFSNITLVRFNSSVTQDFKHKIEELSSNIHILPYTVDSITLLTANAALKKQRIIGNWNLRS